MLALSDSDNHTYNFQVLHYDLGPTDLLQANISSTCCNGKYCLQTSLLRGSVHLCPISLQLLIVTPQTFLVPDQSFIQKKLSFSILYWKYVKLSAFQLFPYLCGSHSLQKTFLTHVFWRSDYVIFNKINWMLKATLTYSVLFQGKQKDMRRRKRNCWQHTSQNNKCW